VKVSDTSALQAGSWTSGVLQHPALFSPAPQDLSEPSSTVTYTVSGQTSVLGATGTASNSDAADGLPRLMALRARNTVPEPS
jgi:hypothetical protein